MFERYDELARRVIFFARLEASRFGSSAIESEHLLLGLLRENPLLRKLVSEDKVRHRIEAGAPQRQSVSTSVDLPLSEETKRILIYGAEEADRRDDRLITPEHLALGVFREEHCLAAQLLREQGCDREKLEAHVVVRTRVPATELDEELGPILSEDLKALGPFAQPVAAQVVMAKPHLLAFREPDSEHKLKRRGWTRKQAMGHLIDLATAHHQWIARALVEPRVTAVSYPAPEWAAAQHYDVLPWEQLVGLWRRLSQLLVLIISQAPVERLKTPVRIGIDPEVTVDKLVTEYVRRVEDVLAEILTEAK